MTPKPTLPSAPIPPSTTIAPTIPSALPVPLPQQVSSIQVTSPKVSEPSPKTISKFAQDFDFDSFVVQPKRLDLGDPTKPPLSPTPAPQVSVSAQVALPQLQTPSHDPNPVYNVPPVPTVPTQQSPILTRSSPPILSSPNPPKVAVSPLKRESFSENTHLSPTEVQRLIRQNADLQSEILTLKEKLENEQQLANDLEIQNDLNLKAIISLKSESKKIDVITVPLTALMISSSSSCSPFFSSAGQFPEKGKRSSGGSY